MTHHIGRSFQGHILEDACPCIKAPCGLAVRERINLRCDQHAVVAAKTIRQSHQGDQCPGSGHPALTREEFEAGAPEVHHGVALCEDENGNFIYAYGHRGKSVMARAINAYDKSTAGESFGTNPGDVVHKWAVTKTPADSPDGRWIHWGEVTQETPGAFPVTMVAR